MSKKIGKHNKIIIIMLLVASVFFSRIATTQLYADEYVPGQDEPGITPIVYPTEEIYPSVEPTPTPDPTGSIVEPTTMPTMEPTPTQTPEFIEPEEKWARVNSESLCIGGSIGINFYISFSDDVDINKSALIWKK